MAASVHDIAVKRIDGAPGKLDAFKGKVLLIVNVASKCGLTPQYKGLEDLHEKYGARGLSVLGCPEATLFAPDSLPAAADLPQFSLQPPSQRGKQRDL